MSPIEAQADAAMARISQRINHSAEQHSRQIEAEYAKSVNFLLGNKSPFVVHMGYGAYVPVTSRAAVRRLQEQCK